MTLLAKPFARELQPRLWPEVRVETFTAPWTAFKHKYHVWRWPLLEMGRLRRRLAAARFDSGLSARWDPRDHLLLKIFGVRERLGFPRLGSRIFLTRPLARPHPQAHRYESWRVLARELGLDLPPRGQNPSSPPGAAAATILIHTGAGPAGPRLAAGKLPAARVPPAAETFPGADRLRSRPARVVAAAGETDVATPGSVTELLALIDRAGAFIGNDSGPGHLAAHVRRADLHAVRPATAGMVRAAASGVGMDGGQGLPLQAVLGLLPVSAARFVCGK